jgi:hypothetical protein
MDLSRQQIVKALRRAGLNDVADTAEAALPDPVDVKTVDEFCAAQGISMATLMDRIGASP